MSGTATGPELLQSAEDKLFDLIEYFHGHVSKGIDEPSALHSYSNCGWHYRAFDPAPGQALFRQRMNPTLVNYQAGSGSTKVGQVARRHSGPSALASEWVDVTTAHHGHRRRSDRRCTG